MTITSSGATDTTFVQSLQIKCVARTTENGSGQYRGEGVIALKYTTAGNATTQTIKITTPFNTILAPTYSGSTPGIVGTVSGSFPFCCGLSVGANKTVETIDFVWGTSPTFSAATGLGPDLQITVPTTVTAQAYKSIDCLFLIVQP